MKANILLAAAIPLLAVACGGQPQEGDSLVHHPAALASDDPLIGLWYSSKDSTWKQEIDSAGNSYLRSLPPYPNNYCWSLDQQAYFNLVKSSTSPNTYTGTRWTGCAGESVPLTVVIGSTGNAFTEYYSGTSHVWYRVQ